MRNRVRLFVLCLGFMGLMGAAGAAKDSVATVSRFRKAPVVDGRIEPGEWDGAVRTTGFMSLKGSWLEKGMGATYCGFTRERLYVAIISELPPDQELRARKEYRDSVLIYDDSFEVWLDPFERTEDGWQGGGTYFQMMGIANGTISDTKFTSEGAPDKGWNGNWNFANGIHKKVTDGPQWARRSGVWVAELSVPFEDLGWKGDPVGRRIGVLVARNFKRTRGWKQVTWFPHKRSFASWFQYPQIRLTGNAPSVQVRKLGENVLSGDIDLEARIFNPGPERKVRVSTEITSSDMPSIQEEKALNLPANDSFTYKHSVPPGRLHETASHRLNLKVSSPDGAAEYINYFVNIKQRGQFWNVRTGPQPDRAVRLAYYPSYNFIKIRVDTRELSSEAAEARDAQVRIMTENGDEVFAGQMSWEEDVGENRFEVGDLPDGQYTVTVEVSGGDYRRSFTRTFRRTHFVWENNKLGVSDQVFEPFKPIRVDGRELSVVMRRYRKGGLGLWESVQAIGNDQNSKYREILTAPMSLKIQGQPLNGDGRFTSTSDHKVVYEGMAEHPAVQVRTRTITEYDGCMRVEMTLQPGDEGTELQDLVLDIPIRDDLAPLFHATTTALRRNPSGSTPKGEGRIWDSRDFPDGEWYGNFHPYYWLGGPERGIAWFADNDRGWVLNATPENPSKSVPCQELIRKGDTLTLRVNFVQKPITLEQKRTIVFGLIASPVKPMRRGWRRILFRRSYGDYPSITWLGSVWAGTGGRPDMGGTYPVGKDMSILNKMQELRMNGGNAGRFLDIWLERSEKIAEFGDTQWKRFRGQSRRSLQRSAGVGRDYLNMYWEEFHRVSRTHPETTVFGNEWSGGYGKGSMHTLAPSYIDFQCWYGAEYLRRGIGLYFDNTFPKRTGDVDTTAAYRRPGGVIQPSANMWRHREYLKRIWILHKQLAPAETPPVMMLHMTNTHILPYMGWNQSNLDLEWFYGPDPQQSKYSHDLLRAEAIGLQTGNIPLALATVKDAESAEERELAYRSRFGTLFAHEIKWRYKGGGAELMNTVLDFGYGREDCRVFNYWDPDCPVTTSNPEVKSILLERKGRLLLVLTTWNAEPETVEVSLATDRFDDPVRRAEDVETGETITFEDGQFRLEMAGYGVRVLQLD